MSKKKTLFNVAFLLIVFLITIFAIFHGEDMGAMADALKKADIRWLLPGIPLVAFSIWGESIIIWYTMRSFGVRLKKRICFLFSSVGYFFCYLTPSATGGQPMQIYFMKKERIPVPFATVILMIITITYKLVLVVIGLAIPIFAQGFLHRYLKEVLPVFYLGIGLNVFCVSFMTLLVFHPDMAEKWLLAGMALLERIHLMKRRPQRREKLARSMQIYRETAEYLKTHFRILVYVILITFAQRIALFAVTWIVYRSFGLSGTSAWDIILLQSVISISVDMLPLPGGMGVSEALFLKIFVPVFQSLTLPAMILSRGLSYYAQLLISALFTVVAQIYYTMASKNEGDTEC